MNHQTGRLLGGAITAALGVWLLAGGNVDVVETLLDKPLALALPSAVILLGGILTPVRPRSVALSAAVIVAMTAVLQGAAWWQVDEGAVQGVAEATRTSLLVAALCLLLLCAGMLLAATLRIAKQHAAKLSG